MSCINCHTWVLAEISILCIGPVCNADVIQSYTNEHQHLLEDSSGTGLHCFGRCDADFAGLVTHLAMI